MTAAGAIVAAFGARFADDFPDYSVVYGAPSNNGLGVEIGKSIRIHWAQAKTVLSGSQMGGATVVSPVFFVTISRPFEGVSTELESHQATLDLCADLAQSLLTRVMDHVLGTDPIDGLSGVAVWVTDFVETPAVLDIGDGCSTETATVELRLNHSSTYHGR